MSKPNQTTAAAKWMMEGIKQHESFRIAFSKAKDAALNAGFFFLAARECLKDGDWGLFLEGYTHKISRRTVERYAELATEALEWVKAENPKLLGLDNLSAAARDMVLQSPKGLVALCRELKLMRKFGDYDAIKYHRQKLIGEGDAGQIEFDFSVVEKTLDLLCNPRATINFPAGTDEVAALESLKLKLQGALKKIDDEIAEWKAQPI